MITMYIDKIDIPENMELIEYNDEWFDTETCNIASYETLKKYVENIDESIVTPDKEIISKFTRGRISIGDISTGCKTLLNVICYPDKAVSVIECGWNVMDVIFTLERGNIYMPYDMVTMIENPFKIVKEGKQYIINDYEEYMKIRGLR